MGAATPRSCGSRSHDNICNFLPCAATFAGRRQGAAAFRSASSARQQQRKQQRAPVVAAAATLEAPPAAADGASTVREDIRCGKD